MSTGQLALTDPVWPCDICQHGLEVDPETGLQRRCRVCQGTGWLDYEPPGKGGGPFDGMDAT